MLPRFTMTWDCDELARAFKVTPNDIKEYLTDGRRVSFIIERRLVWEHPRAVQRSLLKLIEKRDLSPPSAAAYRS